MDLSITEALCGFQRAISTLDKREIVITTLPGTGIQRLYLTN